MSLFFRYNPNDDFNLTALHRWVSYSDYYYYKGVRLFDSFEDLAKKIEQSDLQQMNQDMLQHSVDNAKRLQDNWRSINKYFYGDKEDHDSVSIEPLELPLSFQAGLKQWTKKIERPNLEPNSTLEISSYDYKNGESTWVLIRVEDYLTEFKGLPHCENFNDFHLVFYGKTMYTDSTIGKCNYTFFSTNQKKQLDKNWMDLKILMNVTAMNALNIIFLEKNTLGCTVESKYKQLIHNSTGWTQRSFYSQQFFLAWLPFNREVLSYWLDTVMKFTNRSKVLPLICSINSFKTKDYTKEELLRLEDYLKYWVTDETLNFFHIIDQLNFELAVKGYITKSNAIMYRHWMKHLASCNIPSVPSLVISGNKITGG